MTPCSLSEIKKFIESFSDHSSLADFGGGRTKKRLTEFLNRNITTYDLEGGDIILDLEKEKIVKEKYQSIICSDLLEHAKNPFAIAENIATALVDGGHAFISAPFYWKKHGQDYFRFSQEGLFILFQGRPDIKLIESKEIKDGEFIRSIIIIEKICLAS